MRIGRFWLVCQYGQKPSAECVIDGAAGNNLHADSAAQQGGLFCLHAANPPGPKTWRFCSWVRRPATSRL